MKYPSTNGKSKAVRFVSVFDRISRTPPPAVRWGIYAILVAGLAAAGVVPALRIYYPLGFGVPVMLASWWEGRGAGYGLAGLSTILLMYSQSVPQLVVRVVALVVLVELVSRTGDLARRVRVLEGLLSICGFCHRIRDEKGKWVRLERYLPDHSEAGVLQTYCPDCVVIRR